MIDQGIASANIVLHHDKFCKQVFLPTEEVLGLKGDYSFNISPLFLIDELSCCRFVIHKRADDDF